MLINFEAIYFIGGLLFTRDEAKAEASEANMNGFATAAVGTVPN